MSVTVKKLEGAEVPAEFRDRGVLQVFEVLDGVGAVHYREDEVDAAKLAVALSDETRGEA